MIWRIQRTLSPRTGYDQRAGSSAIQVQGCFRSHFHRDVCQLSHCYALTVLRLVAVNHNQPKCGSARVEGDRRACRELALAAVLVLAIETIKTIMAIFGEAIMGT